MTDIAARYIERVLERVVAPASRVERLREDLEGHFAEAAASDGASSEAEVIRHLGPPEDVAASFMADVDMHYAGFWVRFFAFIGDLGITFVTMIPLVALCTVLAPFGESYGGYGGLMVMALLITFGVSTIGILVLYFPVLEHFFGTTCGKRVLKLRVVTEAGAPISLGAAFLRRIPLFFELVWLDALFVPFTAKKQRAFDIVAKTVVIYEPDETPSLGGWLLCLAPWVLIATIAALAAFLLP